MIKHLKLGFLVAIFCASTAQALSPAPDAPKRPKWLLGTFLGMSHSQPKRLLSISRRLFSDERLRQASVDSNLAFEWQHRLAAIGALSEFFDPGSEKSLGMSKGDYRKQAREIIVAAMTRDPSLLVRDGAVETVRRVLRMQPGEAKLWRDPLEKSFFDPRNIVQGEGLFIRETILTALREGSLPLSARVRKAALHDKSPSIQSLVKRWKTEAYDQL